MAKVGTPSVGRLPARSMLVGRAAELYELEDRLAEVQRTRELRALTVIGAPGVGKTRLFRDFLSRPRADEGDVRVFRGAAREGGGPFDVVGRVLRARFGLVEGMLDEDAVRVVREVVTEVLDDRKVSDVLYFLGPLLGLDFPRSPLIDAIAEDPAELSRVRKTVLRRFLEVDARASKHVTVLVFDDLQHAEADALELVRDLVATLRGPVLVLTGARPELLVKQDGWFGAGRKVHRLLELSPLSEADASAVMQELLAPAGDDPAALELVDAACTMAGGNPALLEKMVRIFLDIGALEAEDGPFGETTRWTVRPEKLAGATLPLTVEDAVDARISALAPDERELLEQAASMGSVFWVGGLVAIARLDVTSLEVWRDDLAADRRRVRSLLASLVERDYVLSVPDATFGGDEEYVFKHNLERERLVRLVPPAQARIHHRAIASWLSFKANVHEHEESLGTLARHRELAGLPLEAAAAYLDAGDVARERYANVKACECYGRSLELYRKTHDAPLERYLRALHHLGDVLQLLGKNDEALAAFREMLVAAYRVDLRSKGGAAHGRIGRLYRETGRLDDAETHLEAARALFELATDDRGIASTLDDLGKLHWLRGDYKKALELAQKALAMRRRIGDRRSIALSLNNLGLVYQDSGQFKLALDAFEQALRIRREIGDWVGVSVSLNNLGTVAQDQKDDTRALELFLEAYQVAKETGDRTRIALVLTNLGETETRLGRPEQAIVHLKEAEAICEELGDKMGLAEVVRSLGRAHLARRDLTHAREAMARAVALFRAIDSRVQLGTTLRAFGEVLAAGSAGGAEMREARTHFLQAIEIFETVGNDVELAETCRAYADVLHASPETALDPELGREADRYADRAQAVFARIRASSFGIDEGSFGLG